MALLTGIRGGGPGGLGGLAGRPGVGGGGAVRLGITAGTCPPLP